MRGLKRIGWVVLLAAALSGGTMADTAQLLTVTGQAAIEVPTHRVEVRLAINVTEPTAQAASSEAAKRAAAVVSLLERAKVDKLTTTGIQLSAQTTYDNRRQRIVGYTARNGLSFRVEADKAGGLLDKAIEAGATEISSIRFFAEAEDVARANRQALADASRDARDQADTVLAALGLRRYTIHSIRVGHAQAAPPQPMLRMAAAESDASTPVVGGGQTVRAQVTLEVRYVMDSEIAGDE